MTPDQIASIVTQLPMVAILVWLFMQQANAHQKAIDYYRGTLDKVLQWLMEQELKAQEIKDERPG